MTENKGNSIYESIGRLFSREQIKTIARYLNMAGIYVSAEAFAGFFMLGGFMVALIMILLLTYYQPFFIFSTNVVRFFVADASPTVVMAAIILSSFIVVYTFAALILYTIILLQIETRRLALETVLPDYLTLIAANIRAGMTLDHAMWYAAKPEFGILTTEVRATMKRAFSGEPLDQVLDALAERFNSKVFTSTITLIKQALVTGGEIAAILEKVSTDSRNSVIIKKEISASLLMYNIFVVFAATVGTPFLFAVSNKLLTILQKAFSYVPSGTSFNQAGFALAPAAPFITPTEFFFFSLLTLFITSLFSALIIGVIQTGSKWQGLRYFPFIAVCSYIVYFFISAVLDAYFSSIIV